jgi:flagellar hook-associated protein 1 FlgK
LPLFGLFDIGKSALFASQTALSVTSHNIANVNTPGYTRQDVVFKIANPENMHAGSLGRGVTVSSIKRQYDRFIQSQLLGQHQNYGKSFAMNQTLGQVEQVFNEAQGMGIATALSEYLNAWNDVSANPEGYTQRVVLLQKANALVTNAKQMERGITDSLKRSNEEIKGIGDQINSIASQIADINGSIVQAESGSGSGNANDLRDQRDSLLNDLAELVDFSTYEDANGAITVTVGMRSLVYGENTNTFSTRMNTDGFREVYLAGSNITSSVQKGKLGGLIGVRDNVTSNILHDFRKLVASLIKETNQVHSAGYGLDASTGNNFFNSLQINTSGSSDNASVTSASITNMAALTLDEYDVTFDAANNYFVHNRQTGSLVTSGAYVSGGAIAFDGIQVAVSGTVNAADHFTVSPLEGAIANFGVAVSDQQKIAASSSGSGLPGNNANAIQIADLFNSSITDLGDTGFMDYYQGIVSNAGTLSRAASNSLQFDDNLLAEISNRRDSVSGVSLDEEAANLIRYQRSYEAGARMIKITDELLQTILNL